MKIGKTVLMAAAVTALAVAAGCGTLKKWTAGSVTEGVPKLRKPLPLASKVYFADPVNASGHALHERNRKQVQDAFAAAFDAVGVSHSVTTNGCDTAFRVAVVEWEYGDAGFSGRGARDSVSLAVIVMNMDTERVLARYELYARDLDALVLRYVEKVFADE